MVEDSQVVSITKRLTLTVVNKSGSLYMKIPYDQNKAWGFMAGDVVSVGVMDLSRPGPKATEE